MNKCLFVICAVLLAGCNDGRSDKQAKTSQDATLTQIINQSVSDAADHIVSDVEATETGNFGQYSEIRQAIFMDTLKDWWTIGAMVQGQKAFDADAFRQHAQIFSDKTLEPFGYFQQDQPGLNGNAKDEVWTQAAKFKKEEEKFRIAVAKFNQSAARAKDAQAVKANYAALRQSCISCHEAFKEGKTDW